MSTVPATLSASDIATAITSGFERFIESEMRRSFGGERHNVYASAWSACTRKMSLEMLEPDRRPEFSTDTLANFRRGNDRERDLLADLQRAGRNADPPFEVIAGQERFELRDRKGRVAITGKVDARLRIVGTSKKPPVELKAWHPNLSGRIETFDDVFENRWTRRGGHQLLAYLLGNNEPFGFLVLDRNGLPKILPVELDRHLDRIEDFLARSEAAIDAKLMVLAHGRDYDRLPPFVTDPSECRMCEFFGSSCNPPLSDAAARIVTDETWIQKIDRWAELDDAGHEFDRLDKSIKKKFRGTEIAIAGRHLLRGEWKPADKVDPIPAEEQKIIDDIVTKYTRTDPKGRFYLAIERLPEQGAKQ